MKAEQDALGASKGSLPFFKPFITGLELRPQTDLTVSRSLVASSFILLMGLTLPLSLISVEAAKWPAFIASIVVFQALFRFPLVRQAVAQSIGWLWFIVAGLGLAYFVGQGMRTIAVYQEDADVLLPLKPLLIAGPLLLLTMWPVLIRTAADVPDRSIVCVRRLFLILLVGIALTQLLALSALALGSESGFAGLVRSTRQFNRSSEALAILVFVVPLVWSISDGRFSALVGGCWLTSFLAIGVVPGRGDIGHVHSETVLTVLICGLLVFLVARHVPRLSTYLVFCGAALLVLTGPLLYPILLDLGQSLSGLPAKLGVRLEIYAAVAKDVFNAPLFGQGLSALGHGEALLMPGPLITEPPSHPHNGWLQLWQDTGLVGVTFFMLLCAAVCRFVLGLPERAVAPVLAAFSSGFLSVAVTHGLWQSWWLSVLGSVAFIVGIMALNKRRIHQADAP